jgi:hypothetical protein
MPESVTYVLGRTVTYVSGTTLKRFFEEVGSLGVNLGVSFNAGKASKNSAVLGPPRILNGGRAVLTSVVCERL